MPYLRQTFGEQIEGKIGEFESITLPSCINNVIIINQDPIGKTPRSNPATYTKLFDEIRDLFAQTQEAKMRGYEKGRLRLLIRSHHGKRS
jgi:excinuclease ABC subunit A